MTFDQIWILEKVVQQLSKLPHQKPFSPWAKGGGHFGQNGHIIGLGIDVRNVSGPVHGNFPSMSRFYNGHQ
jgi:hypothetical protein